tara:strand:- start:357 stop:1238 length:882 start_codon:yes stop_codon:yes gene_type:complete
MTRGQEAIQKLAGKYNLSKGIDQDYYLCHSTWCVTKNGAQKIMDAEGITMEQPIPHGEGTPFVAYMAKFKDKQGNEVWINGSCRTDTTKNTPERTHSPELAWKRMKVRGILELTAAGQSIYGSDELTDDYKKHGNDALQMNVGSSAPAQPVQQQAPAQPAPALTGYAADLPTDWNDLMGKFADAMSQDRGSFESKVLDHVGKFEKEDGSPWFPSQKYSSFVEIVNAGKSGWALKMLKSARTLYDMLYSLGSVEIDARNSHGGSSKETLATKSNRQSNESVPPQIQNIADDVPF